MVLIRKTVQPMGVLSELYIDREMVSFAYDTLPAGERCWSSRSVFVSSGNHCAGSPREIVVPASVFERVKQLLESDVFNIEVLERWAVRA